MQKKVFHGVALTEILDAETGQDKAVNTARPTRCRGMTIECQHDASNSPQRQIPLDEASRTAGAAAAGSRAANQSWVIPISGELMD